MSKGKVQHPRYLDKFCCLNHGAVLSSRLMDHWFGVIGLRCLRRSLACFGQFPFVPLCFTLQRALWFAWVMRKIVFASLLQFEVSKVKRLTLLLMTLHALTLCIFKSNMISAKILCEPAKWAAFQLQLTKVENFRLCDCVHSLDFQQCSCNRFSSPHPHLPPAKAVSRGSFRHVKVLQLFLIGCIIGKLGLPGSAVPGTRRGGSFKNRTCL